MLFNRNPLQRRFKASFRPKMEKLNDVCMYYILYREVNITTAEYDDFFFFFLFWTIVIMLMLERSDWLIIDLREYS